jgi:hypothetical protein
LAQSPERIVVRLQTITAEAESDWSEPSESISVGGDLAATLRHLSIRAGR